MVRLALNGEFVPYAVNVSAAAEVPELVRPFLPLAERLGALLTGLAEGAVRTVQAQYLGRIGEADTRVLTLAVVKGVLRGVVHEPVSFVNAPIIARERGIAISEMRSSVSSDYVNLISVTAETDQGEVSVAGTLVGKRNDQRVMHVNGYDIEMAPADQHAVLRVRGPPRRDRHGRHDPRRAPGQHRDDGRGPRVSGRHRVDGSHARQPRGPGRDRRDHLVRSAAEPRGSSSSPTDVGVDGVLRL